MAGKWKEAGPLTRHRSGTSSLLLRGALLALSIVLTASCSTAPILRSADPNMRDLVIPPQSAQAGVFGVPPDQWEAIRWINVSSEATGADWSSVDSRIVVTEYVDRFPSLRGAKAEFDYRTDLQLGKYRNPQPSRVQLPIVSGVDEEVIHCKEGPPDGLCLNWFYQLRFGRSLWTLYVQSSDGQTAEAFADGVRSLAPPIQPMP
jgi:hypothetical protein